MAAICGLGLESYLQIHKALTKGSEKVQAVTPMEECYYKVQDLKQVLAIHSLSTGKFNRTELLQALKGSALVNPFNIVQKSPNSTDQHHQSTAPAVEGSSCAPDISSFALPSGADLAALGWADEGADVLVQPMQLLGIDLLEGFEDLPAIDTDLAWRGAMRAASHLDAPTQDNQHHQSSQNDHDTPQYHDPQHLQQQQQQQAMPLHPAPAAAAAETAEAWHMTKRSDANSSMPDVEAQRHVIAGGQAVPMQADAPPVPGTVAGGQHKTTTATAAAAIIKSMQGQTATVAGAQHMHATAVYIQQHSASVQHCHHEQAQQLERQQRQQPQIRQVQMQQAAADAESADETEAGDDDSQLSGAADAETLITAATASQAHPLKQLLQEAGLQDAKHVTPQPHTSWLLQQLQVFAAAGAVASQESLPAPAAVAAASLAGSMIGGSNVLLGRHVAFVLTEEMSVAGTKGKQLTMPAGVYQGRVLQYLGTCCQPELCEASCPGTHQHYRAGVIPPQLPDTDHIEFLGAHDAAAGIAQAQAAATGRPVRLILDLHPHLRCQKLTDMLKLNNTMLQDAWILLKEEEQPSSSIHLQDDKEAPDVVSSVVARGRGYGRGGRGGRAVVHGPRIKRAKN